MSEEKPEKITFTKSTPLNRRKEALEMIEVKGKQGKKVQDYESTYLQDHRLSWPEKKVIKHWLINARSVLTQIGLGDLSRCLPQLNQITVINSLPENVSYSEFGGRTIEYGSALRVIKPPYSPLNDERAARVFYHEVFHFITKQLIRFSETDHKPQMLAKGFDQARVVESCGKKYYTRIKGLYSEPLAELFSMLCLNKDITNKEITIETSYDHTHFIIALIKNYSQKKGIGFVEGLVAFFKGYLTRDFLLQKEIVGLYGTAFVRQLNNINTYFGSINNTEEARGNLIELARQGGFLEDYQAMQAQIEREEPLSIPEMKGKIIIYMTPLSPSRNKA